MFLLVCEASMGLTKSSHARTCTQHTHTHIHTHTHTLAQLCWSGIFLRGLDTQWSHILTTMKTQEFYWAAQRRSWQLGDMGTMSSWAQCCHTLRGCQLFQPWPSDAETCIKFDQSTLCFVFSVRASHACPSELSETMRWWEASIVVHAVCSVSDSNMKIIWQVHYKSQDKNLDTHWKE